MPSNYDHLMGWKDEPKAVYAAMADLPFPLFKDAYGNIKGTGKGKTLLLPDIVRKVIGYFPMGHQLTGDCVSFGAGYATTVLSALQIALGKLEVFEGEVATEPIYGGSRIQVGGGALGYGQGSVGLWAAKWLNRYAVIIRKNYTDFGIDLSKYDVDKATKWGNPNNGCPDALVKANSNHLVKTISQVNSYEEARDAIYNGYPITVASNVGFSSMTRDSEGFMRASGSWAHQMYFCGVKDDNRPGLLCCNSWGTDWSHGPRPMDIPEGSFFVDADTVNMMFAQGDSWVFSNFDGFEVQELTLDWD